MSDTEEVILSAEKISLKYHARSGIFKKFEHTALENINFKLYRGETLGVLGRNGCGKSSLLRILAGIISPTQGEIVSEKSIRRALLTLGLGFRPDLSGRNNAILSAMLGGMPKRNAIQAIDEIKEFAELGKFFDQPVKTYSAGMRARLGFATAMKTEVDVLLIDEVLSVGDAHFRNKAQTCLRERMNRQQAVVFVSHNPHQIEAICERVMWLEAGRVRSMGDIKTVVSAYAEFLSELN
ncbi:MAG: ABC transporter ATP-binding protein [Candidatus Thiodiazotropha sp. (ex Myrtea spinifera)]|nr:ABC transporter ATP-binding protein [Candidatus Thiodiazotropha sp. (ex Myrtea spinifera)]